MRPIQQLWLIPHELSEKHPGALSWGAGDAEASRFKPSTCVKVLGWELCGYSGRGGGGKFFQGGGGEKEEEEEEESLFRRRRRKRRKIYSKLTQ